MTKFSKFVFIGYILLIAVAWLISKYLYWTIILSVLFLQVSNLMLRNWVDSVTKYKDSISHEEEKLRFFYMYFGFPITVMFPKRFREMRKDSYFERRVKELESMEKFYTQHGVPVKDEIRDELIICNRYLKLKKIKHKQEEV